MCIFSDIFTCCAFTLVQRKKYFPNIFYSLVQSGSITYYGICILDCDWRMFKTSTFTVVTLWETAKNILLYVYKCKNMKETLREVLWCLKHLDIHVYLTFTCVIVTNGEGMAHFSQAHPIRTRTERYTDPLIGYILIIFHF